jgi:hypothetical protein
LPGVLIFRNLVNILIEKYFAFTETQINAIDTPSLTRKRGARAIATDVGFGMRWPLWCRQARGMEADGEGVWSWFPDAGIKSASDLAGDGAIKPGTPGRARYKPIKPSCRECRMISAYLW